VDTSLLVGGSHDRRLLVLVRVEGSGEVELQALGHVVLELELGAEDVRGRPCLGVGEAVRLVGVLELDITGDGAALVVLHTSDAESSVALGLGLDLERDALERVVLAEEVARRLAEVLQRVNQPDIDN
jgi:hypothetical protein